MKKALDYVSDYQLKSACKDALCIALSKVTQMIFAVLEDRYHHIVFTHSCKLVSFFYIYLYNSVQTQEKRNNIWTAGPQPVLCAARSCALCVLTRRPAGR